MASEIRVDKINSLSGVGTVTLSPTGVDIAGITTAATLRATTGIVTSLTAGSLTSLGAVSGTTGTFSGAVSGTTGTFSAAVSGTTGTFTGDVDIADKIAHTGDTDTAIRFPSANTISFEANGSERVRINADGKFGIGTNDPQRTLHLSSNNTVLALTDTAASTDQKTKYILSDAGAFAFGKLSDDYGTATEQFRIGNSGNIGVGEQSPSAALDVKGSGVPIIINSSNSNTYKIQFENNGSTLGYIGAVTDSIVFSNSSAAEQARFTDAGLKLPSGRGIDFSATGDASGKTSELLDDYEEGTWSPVWSNATSGGTTSVSAQMHGRYTKIGRMVTIHFFTWALPTGPSGSIYLQGLPFAAGEIGEVFGAVQALSLIHI